MRIGVIGDRHDRFKAQESIHDAVRHSGDALGVEAVVEWVPTPALEHDAESKLEPFDALWCAPGSPYASLDGALEGIRVTRTSGRPFLGTCAGFQHGVLEFARNVVGVDARHAEYGDDGTGTLFVDELLCSLVGQTMRLAVVDPPTAARFGADEVSEQYYCRFGLAESRLPELERHGMVVAGRDRSDGGTRILRLDGHAYYYLTLFVPQASSTAEQPHPLVTGLLEAAVQAAVG